MVLQVKGNSAGFDNLMLRQRSLLLTLLANGESVCLVANSFDHLCHVYRSWREEIVGREQTGKEVDLYLRDRRKRH